MGLKRLSHGIPLAAKERGGELAWASPAAADHAADEQLGQVWRGAAAGAHGLLLRVATWRFAATSCVRRTLSESGRPETTRTWFVEGREIKSSAAVLALPRSLLLFFI